MQRGRGAGGTPQTLVLSAPTGSGKTVIATTWMERLFEGDELRAADPNATFLWLTDQTRAERADASQV